MWFSNEELGFQMTQVFWRRDYKILNSALECLASTRSVRWNQQIGHKTWTDLQQFVFILDPQDYYKNLFSVPICLKSSVYTNWTEMHTLKTMIKIQIKTFHKYVYDFKYLTVQGKFLK